MIDGRSAKPAKACYDCDADILEWILAPLGAADRARFTQVVSVEGGHGKAAHKSLDCSIMDAADDIAYGVHDLEDAAALLLINEEKWREGVPPSLLDEFVASLDGRPLDGVEPTYDGVAAALFGEGGPRKRLIGRLVHACIAATYIEAVGAFEEPLLAHRVKLRDGPAALLQALRALINEIVIQGARVQQLDFKGQRMVLTCFEALQSAPDRLLSDETYRSFGEAGDDPRVLSDHLASLTDAGLLRLYDRLFSPRMGSIFDRV